MGPFDGFKEEPMLSSIPRSARGTPKTRTVAGLICLTVVAAVFLCPTTPCEAEVTGKLGGAIDPDALQVLKGMTDYLAGLEQFSMHTENVYDDVLETGQKLQFGFSSDVVVKRPDGLVVERTDGLTDHLFVFDGETLATYHAEDGFYAMVPAPDNLDDLLHFARDVLDLVPPAGDMIFTNSFDLLTASVTSGVLVGQAVIDGTLCNHIAFRTPLVDWQLWIADGDMPLPYKYVLTTKDDPAQPQFITWMSNWEIIVELEDGTFLFEAPDGAVEIDYIVLDTAGR